jgi:polyphosphate glucokinase
MNVLVIDIGGTNIKALATGQKKRRRFPSGQEMTPERMVSEIKAITKDWSYDAVSIGYPGPVLEGQIVAEPKNLAKGWVGFDFERAFKRPIRILNDAAMQALGSFEKGKMLFLGLGTGLGSCAVVNGRVGPLELAHLPYKKGTYEDYVGRRRLESRGRKKWSKDVGEVVGHLTRALQPNDVVLGGGNARRLKVIPHGCRLGSNANAFVGGFRMWNEDEKTTVQANRGKLSQKGDFRTSHQYR